jgi:hypothetical protein
MDEILTPEQWTDLQGRLRAKYPELRDSDLQYEEAAEKDMLRMIKYKLHIIRNEMKYVLDYV